RGDVCGCGAWARIARAVRVRSRRVAGSAYRRRDAAPRGRRLPPVRRRRPAGRRLRRSLARPLAALTAGVAMTLPALLGDYWGMLLSFVLLYPITMSFIWMIGSVVFYFRHERHPHRSSVSEPPERSAYPRVAILVPCFNEEANVREAIEGLMRLHYPDFE